MRQKREKGKEGQLMRVDHPRIGSEGKDKVDVGEQEYQQLELVVVVVVLKKKKKKKSPYDLEARMQKPKREMKPSKRQHSKTLTLLLGSNVSDTLHSSASVLPHATSMLLNRVLILILYTLFSYFFPTFFYINNLYYNMFHATFYLFIFI